MVIRLWNLANFGLLHHLYLGKLLWLQTRDVFEIRKIWEFYCLILYSKLNSLRSIWKYFQWFSEISANFRNGFWVTPYRKNPRNDVSRIITRSYIRKMIHELKNPGNRNVQFQESPKRRFPNFYFKSLGNSEKRLVTSKIRENDVSRNLRN